MPAGTGQVYNYSSSFPGVNSAGAIQPQPANINPGPLHAPYSYRPANLGDPSRSPNINRSRSRTPEPYHCSPSTPGDDVSSDSSPNHPSSSPSKRKHLRLTFTKVSVINLQTMLWAHLSHVDFNGFFPSPKPVAFCFCTILRKKLTYVYMYVFCRLARFNLEGGGGMDLSRGLVITANHGLTQNGVMLEPEVYAEVNWKLSIFCNTNFEYVYYILLYISCMKPSMECTGLRFFSISSR